MTKSVTINIAAGDLAFLTTNKYSLCVAKKVGTTYNVVWQSSTRYMANNSFSWTPAFELFGSNQYQDGVQVDVSNTPVDILLGEESTLQARTAILTPARSGGPSTAVTMLNEYGPIHPGLSQVSTNLDGTTSVTPIYIAPLAATLGTVTLTPVDEVMVWFEQSIATATMFSDAKANPAYIDLTASDAEAYLYSGGKWFLQGAPATGVGEPGTLTIIATVTGAVIAVLLADKIASFLTGVWSAWRVTVRVAGARVDIGYRPKSNLSTHQQQQAALFKGLPVDDQLTMFALQGLAAQNVDISQLTVKAG